MKIMTISLLCLSLVLSFAARSFGRKVEAVDYEKIISYVGDVEKNGFNQAKFDDFATERKIMRKNVDLATPLELMFNTTAAICVITALGIVIFQWPKKK